MRRFVLLLLLLLAALSSITAAAMAQEKISLSVAETKPSNNEYRMERMTILFDDPATAATDEGAINIQLLGQNGEPVSCVYNAQTTPTGTTLITGLNKANLSTAYVGNGSTGSLKQRVFHRLVVMGESTAVCGKTLTGTLQGAVP